jgi:hypothetical protein
MRSERNSESSSRNRKNSLSPDGTCGAGDFTSALRAVLLVCRLDQRPKTPSNSNVALNPTSNHRRREVRTSVDLAKVRLWRPWLQAPPKARISLVALPHARPDGLSAIGRAIRRTRRTNSKSATTSIFANVLSRSTAALLTRMSTRPQSFSARAAIAESCSKSGYQRGRPSRSHHRRESLPQRSMRCRVERCFGRGH